MLQRQVPGVAGASRQSVARGGGGGGGNGLGVAVGVGAGTIARFWEQETVSAAIPAQSANNISFWVSIGARFAFIASLWNVSSHPASVPSP